MRSRTASESVRTSRPSTWAEPPLRGNRPVSILMTVVFPLPFGPRKPKISPFSTRKVTSLTAVKPPNLRTRCSAEMAARTGDCGSVAIVSARRFKFHVRGHPGEHAARRVVDADFYPEDLMDAFLAGLYVAGKEFGLLIDLLHFSVKNGVGKGIDANFRLLPEPDASELRLGNVNTDVDLVLLEKRGDRSIRGDDISRPDIEDFHDGAGGRHDLTLAEAGKVVSVDGFGVFDVFAAIAAFHFLEVGLRLKIARFCGGNLFATVPALHFIELVLGHLPLCEGHFPICFCGVPLLPGDQILFGETVVTVKVEPRADFIGFGAFQIVLRDINFLFAVTVLPQLIVRFGLSCGGARLGNFLRTVAALRLLRVGVGLFESSRARPAPLPCQSHITPYLGEPSLRRPPWPPPPPPRPEGPRGLSGSSG